MKFQSNCICNRLHLHVIDPMSVLHGAHICMNLLNKLRTRAKMRNNTGARALDSISATRGALM